MLLNLPDSFDELLGQRDVKLAGALLGCVEDLRVGALHVRLLQLNHVLDVRRVVLNVRRQRFELRVELCDSVLHQKPQQVQPPNQQLLQ